MIASQSPHRLVQGSVVWVEVAVHSGTTKRRPAVVITASDEIILDRPIELVPITTTFADPVPRTHVELPWSPFGHPATRLRRRSAAVCDVVKRVHPSDVEVVGYVPTRYLLAILERIRELHRDSDA